LGYKNAAKRPEANKGGREEEKRFKIATGLRAFGWLRSKENGEKMVAWLAWLPTHLFGGVLGTVFPNQRQIKLTSQLHTI
jgi:hypothetical protein